MLFLVLWAETLLSHCEAIKRVGKVVKAVERPTMVVIHLHLLLRRPLTFSSGEETPFHPSGLQRQTRVLQTSQHMESSRLGFVSFISLSQVEGICCNADLRHEKLIWRSAESGAGVSPPCRVFPHLRY
jgi:hypothetical protein